MGLLVVLNDEFVWSLYCMNELKFRFHYCQDIIIWISRVINNNYSVKNKLTRQKISTNNLPLRPLFRDSLSAMIPPPNAPSDPNIRGIHDIHSSNYKRYIGILRSSPLLEGIKGSDWKSNWIVPTRWSWITEPPLVGQGPVWVCMMKQPHMEILEPCHLKWSLQKQ